MAMVVQELIPMCQKLGLGTTSQSIGTMGISMGGYGAILLAEKCPTQISAVAAISPAIWTTYDALLGVRTLVPTRRRTPSVQMTPSFTLEHCPENRLFGSKRGAVFRSGPRLRKLPAHERHIRACG